VVTSPQQIHTGKAGASAQKPKRQPMRTCVACRTTGGKRGLVRVVRLPDGAGVVLDLTGKKSGRGAYVCPTVACVTLALKKKQLERSLKTTVSEETAVALRAAVEALESANVASTPTEKVNIEAQSGQKPTSMTGGTLPGT
jgi:uncharacterized protein